MDNDDDTYKINERIDNKGCISYMPCAKFCITATITLSAFIFGCTMLATSGMTAPLTPFYTSLITSSVAIWAPSPSYRDNDKK